MSVVSLNKKINQLEKLDQYFVHSILGDTTKESMFLKKPNIKSFLNINKILNDFQNLSKKLLGKITNAKIKLAYCGSIKIFVCLFLDQLVF